MLKAATQASSTPFHAPPEVEEAISAIGRTEDVCLSPDNSLCAVVDFYSNRVLVFGVRFHVEPGLPLASVDACRVIRSPALARPHGVTFLGNRHLAVGSRRGGVVVFRLSLPDSQTGEVNYTQVRTIGGTSLLAARVLSPGSLDSYEMSPGIHRLLVCNNYWNAVTAHDIEVSDRPRVRNRGVLIEEGLSLPDGIGISPDRKWIGISNHLKGEAAIYANGPGLDRRQPPTAFLSGIASPHGIRFSPDGSRILVADAASPFLHLYERPEGGWSGRLRPTTSLRVLNDDEFFAARTSAREGGIKGLDFHASVPVLVTTRIGQPLRFHHLDALLLHPGRADDPLLAKLSEEAIEAAVRARSHVLDRRWSPGSRGAHALKLLRRRVARGIGRAVLGARLVRFRLINRFSKRRLLDPGGPHVSLTTHGLRLPEVYKTIESVGLGQCKPSRLILWVDDRGVFLDPPDSLKRLSDRGLEIKLSENFGPHTKYFPYVEGEEAIEVPLVTADDDVIYPKTWLKELIRAHEADPQVIHCQRVRRMRLSVGGLLPYQEWPFVTNTGPSHRNFITGVTGVIYPMAFLGHLKRAGRGFLDCCPDADDIWLTVNALRHGVMIAQVGGRPASYPKIPGSQKHGLLHRNVTLGGNDDQLRKTVDLRDIEKLRSCQH